MRLKKSVTKTNSIQEGMLPSCTVPKKAFMAPIVSYLRNTLKFSERKDSFLHSSREYLFVWNSCCLRKWMRHIVPFVCHITLSKQIVWTHPKNTLGLYVFEQLFGKIKLEFDLSCFTCLIFLFSRQHTAPYTQHSVHYALHLYLKIHLHLDLYTHNTHWTLFTGCHTIILNAIHLSLHTENIPNLIEWPLRFRLRNEP